MYKCVYLPFSYAWNNSFLLKEGDWIIILNENTSEIYSVHNWQLATVAFFGNSVLWDVMLCSFIDSLVRNVDTMYQQHEDSTVLGIDNKPYTCIISKLHGVLYQTPFILFNAVRA